MDIRELSDRERRALAALKFHGGFGPWKEGERDELIALLTKKGLVGPGRGVRVLTQSGETALRMLHLDSFTKRPEAWTLFEQEFNVALSGLSRREREKIEAERARLN